MNFFLPQRQYRERHSYKKAMSIKRTAVQNYEGNHGKMPFISTTQSKTNLSILVRS